VAGLQPIHRASPRGWLFRGVAFISEWTVVQAAGSFFLAKLAKENQEGAKESLAGLLCFGEYGEH
jgi:hypothetical protein